MYLYDEGLPWVDVVIGTQGEGTQFSLALAKGWETIAGNYKLCIGLSQCVCTFRCDHNKKGTNTIHCDSPRYHNFVSQFIHLCNLVGIVLLFPKWGLAKP